MMSLQLFEVTQLINFALDRSPSVTCGRDFAHYIAMVTRNILECIQQKTARIQAVDWRKNEVHSCSTDQERLLFFVPVFRTRLPSLRTMYLKRLKRFCIILFINRYAMRRPFQRCVYRGGSICGGWDIALWVRRPTLSLLQAEKSVDKGPILKPFGTHTHTHTHIRLSLTRLVRLSGGPCRCLTSQSRR